MHRPEALRPDGDPNKTTKFKIADHPELQAAVNKARGERLAAEAKKAAEAKAGERGVFDRAEVMAEMARVREALRARNFENPSNKTAA